MPEIPLGLTSQDVDGIIQENTELRQKVTMWRFLAAGCFVASAALAVASLYLVLHPDSNPPSIPVLPAGTPTVTRDNIVAPVPTEKTPFQYPTAPAGQPTCAQVFPGIALRCDQELVDLGIPTTSCWNPFRGKEEKCAPDKTPPGVPPRPVDYVRSNGWDCATQGEGQVYDDCKKHPTGVMLYQDGNGGLPAPVCCRSTVIRSSTR